MWAVVPPHKKYRLALAHWRKAKRLRDSWVDDWTGDIGEAAQDIILHAQREYKMAKAQWLCAQSRRKKEQG